MAKKGIIIAIVVVAAVAAGYYVMNSKGSTTTPSSQPESTKATLPANREFGYYIESSGSWSGSVQGSDFIQRSVQGGGNSFEQVTCKPGGIYSAAIQLQGTGQRLEVSAGWVTLPDNQTQQPQTALDIEKQKNALVLSIARETTNFEVIKQSSTMADYGVVSLSGTC